MPSTKPKKKNACRKPFYALSRKQQWVRKKNESEQSGSNSSQLHECISSELPLETTGNVENRVLESGDDTNSTLFDDPSFSVNRLSSSASAASSKETDNNPESHGLESGDDSYSETNSISFDAPSNLLTLGPSALAASSSSASQSMGVTSDKSHRQDSPTEEIKKWALNETNVPKAAVTRLLHVLKKFHPELPVSFETLLPTPNLPYEIMYSGMYVHFSNWKKSLENILNQKYYNRNGEVHFQLLINIDGLPLFNKSPDYKLYPVLCNVYEANTRPICIGMYSSEKSSNRELPSPEVFLEQLLRDLNFLKSETIQSGNRTFVMNEKVIFLCDAPMRSYLKQIKSHAGYNSCERCCVEGEFDSRSNHVCLLSTNSALRTHSDFVARADPDHHRVGCTSILEHHGVDMVHGFILDYMHMCCLGITKRLLNWWKGGVPRQFEGRIGPPAVKILNEQLHLCKSSIPAEFLRKLRPLSELAYWKASELRLFLLYIGAVVLQNTSIMSRSQYEHFLLFCAAMRILLASKYDDTLCSSLLKKFSERWVRLYGKGFVTYNVHSVMHLYEDYRNFGTLDQINCFNFESYLGLLKGSVRSGYQPFQQVCYRAYYENEKLRTSTAIRNLSHKVNVSKKYDDPYYLPGYKGATHFKKASLKNDCIIHTSSFADSIIKFGSEIGKVHDVFSFRNANYLVVQKFDCVEDFFRNPISSSSVGIFKVTKLLDNKEVIILDESVCKCMLLPHKNFHVAIEIIHAVS